MPVILVIDDEQDIGQCVQDIFREEDPSFTVLKAITGQEGLDFLRDEKPDLILLDLFLYGSLSGIDILRGIRRIDPGVKVAVFTGYERDVFRSFEGREVDALSELGISAYLVKPLLPLDLVRTVRKLIES